MKPTKENLEKLFIKYSNPEYIISDPIEFPHRYRNKYDIELAAFISSMFAYGNVKSMKKFLESIFSLMNSDPLNAISSGKMNCSGLYYRFQSEKDVNTFVNVLKDITLQSGSLNRSVNGEYHGFFNTITANGLSDLKKRIDIIREIFTQAAPIQRRTQGYRQLIGAGNENSARKRYCMFFRWMTRKSFPDFSIYSNILPSELVIPLDTHIMKVSNLLGFRSRKSHDWKTAIEITENLKKFCPEDPLKYDFSLTRPGILGDIFPE